MANEKHIFKDDFYWITRNRKGIYSWFAEKRVAVEMAVTSHPPHRSVRAELPHTAPVKSIGLKSLFRVRMQHFKWRQKAIG